MRRQFGKKQSRLRRVLASLIAEVLERLYVAAHRKIAEIGDESFIYFLVAIAGRHGFGHIATRGMNPTQPQAPSDAFQQFVERTGFVKTTSKPSSVTSRCTADAALADKAITGRLAAEGRARSA